MPEGLSLGTQSSEGYNDTYKRCCFAHNSKSILWFGGAAEIRTPVQNQYLLKNYTYTIDYLGYSQPTFRSNLYDGFISHHFVF